MKDVLYPLILLACAISMTVMMWFMMRGKHHTNASASDIDAEVARLRTALDELRASQQEQHKPVQRSHHH